MDKRFVLISVLVTSLLVFVTSFWAMRSDNLSCYRVENWDVAGIPKSLDASLEDCGSAFWDRHWAKVLTINHPLDPSKEYWVSIAENAIPPLIMESGTLSFYGKLSAGLPPDNIVFAAEFLPCTGCVQSKTPTQRPCPSPSPISGCRYPETTSPSN